MNTSYDSQIVEIVQTIFSTMLGIDVVRDDDAASSTGTRLASIQISGPTPRTLVLAMTDSAARSLSAAMLQTPAEEITDTDQSDVAAELVNMIGGNLKALLPGPSVLTLPTVVVGERVGMKVHGAELIEELGLRCEGGVLCVRVFAPLGTTQS